MSLLCVFHDKLLFLRVVSHRYRHIYRFSSSLSGWLIYKMMLFGRLIKPSNVGLRFPDNIEMFVKTTISFVLHTIEVTSH
jgi:hypothetical protein